MLTAEISRCLCKFCMAAAVRSVCCIGEWPEWPQPVCGLCTHLDIEEAVPPRAQLPRFTPRCTTVPYFPQRGLPFPPACGPSVSALRALCGGPQPAGGSASPASGSAGRRAPPAPSGRARPRWRERGAGRTARPVVASWGSWRLCAAGADGDGPLKMCVTCSPPIRGRCLLSLSWALRLQECRLKVFPAKQRALCGKYNLVVHGDGDIGLNHEHFSL